MTVVAVINVIYQSMIILWGALGLLALAKYAIEQGKDKEERSDAEADEYFSRMERKLDFVLKMNGCDVSEEIIVHPSKNIYDKIIEIDEKIHSMFLEDFSKAQEEKMVKLLKNLKFSCEVHKHEAPETEDKP